MKKNREKVGWVGWDLARLVGMRGAFALVSPDQQRGEVSTGRLSLQATPRTIFNGQMDQMTAHFDSEKHPQPIRTPVEETDGTSLLA